MKRTNQSRTFAPAVSTLEDRCLLSAASHHAAPAMMMMNMKGPTMVSLVSSTISSDMNEVTMTAKVSYAGKVATGVTPPQIPGKVEFKMIMPKGTKMAGMHSGVNNLGTVSLQNGDAMLTAPASEVLNMKLEILYKGKGMFKTSSVKPPMLTMAGVMASSGMSSTSGMSSSSDMGGMKM
jgi:hypothetical protein